MINLVDVNKTNEMLRIKQLYLTAFPQFERYPFWLLLYKAKKKNSDFYAIYDDSEYVGLLYLTYYKDIVYIFYLAIDPSQQAKGYGSKVLQYLEDKYQDKRLLLNIEKVDPAADNYEQRFKRKKFYEKNGFKNTQFEIEKEEIVYEILYFKDDVHKYEYDALFKAYLGRVLSFLF